MDEEQFKAVFIACRAAVQGCYPKWVHTEADLAWKLYDESRPAPEDDPEAEQRWVDLNRAPILQAAYESDVATLKKVAKLVNYEPMEPR